MLSLLYSWGKRPCGLRQEVGQYRDKVQYLYWNSNASHSSHSLSLYWLWYDNYKNYYTCSLTYTHFIQNSALMACIWTKNKQCHCNWQKQIKGKGKVVPVLNYAQCHEDVWGNGGIVPCILELGTMWRWVVSFTPLQ